MRKLAMLLAALVLGGACSEEIIEPPPDPPFVMTVVVVPESVTIDYRETETFNVVVVDQYGELMPDARVEWTSIDSDIASVTEGTVAGASHGVTQVVAFVDGVADTAMVDVAFSQRGVLLKLYDSTNGDQWLDAKNWGREDRRLKNWYGISAWDGNVTQIGLANNGLTGTLPRELGLLDTLRLWACTATRSAGRSRRRSGICRWCRYWRSVRTASRARSLQSWATCPS